MGIDWENILGDKVDLGDAYDSMVFGTSLNNDNSESERPYSLPTFDLDEWMEQTQGRKYQKGVDNKDCDKNTVAISIVLKMYAGFLKVNSGNLPESDWGKALAFFMSEDGRVFMLPDEGQASALDVCVKAFLPSSNIVTNVFNETQFGSITDGDENIDWIAAALCKYYRPYKLNKAVSKFCAIYDFVIDCAKAEFTRAFLEKSSSQIVKLSDIYRVLTEIDYESVNWSAFSKAMDDALKKAEYIDKSCNFSCKYIFFKNKKHVDRYYSLLWQMNKLDCYHFSLAYLLSLNSDCYEHFDKLFDTDRDIILFDGLYEGWQTGSSRKTTLLAFNLWSTYVDKNSRDSTPDNIFCDTNAVYYMEAIKLRYPEYTIGEKAEYKSESPIWDTNEDFPI